MISFVIPAHNEELLIANALRSIQESMAALGDEYEIVVVSDSSTDRTSTISSELGAKVVEVQFRQIAATRNAGARATSGDRIVFVDADTVVTAQALRAAMKAIDAGAVGGGSRVRFDGPVPFYASCLERTLIPIAQRFFGIAGGCFLYCTRRAFLAAGGFDEELFCAEEIYFARRLKRQGRFVILKEHVLTSGRKTHAYSAFGLAWIAFRLACGGRNATRRREGLDFWYGDER